MIDGRRGGSGKYSYRQADYGRRSVRVSHLPEDDYCVRVKMFSSDEASDVIWKLDTRDAELLWAALSMMAKDLSWSDEMETK